MCCRSVRFHVLLSVSFAFHGCCVEDERVRCCRVFFFSSRRRHTRLVSDWSSDVCSSDLSFVVLITPGKVDQPLYSRLWGSGFLPSEYQGVQFRSGKEPVLYLGNPAGISGEIGRASCRERVEVPVVAGS